ncbi:hypothetical protein LCGC14_0428650 [marine sediment metagenome]|uniref:Uncharacterized protein n=1 Tax=marine sediment metagenome TaxID=412755 RepID=A0A0F9SNT3_9ZZZZ
MDEKQIKAAKAIERALNKAGRAGLTGGVFDSKFYLWPGTCEDVKPGEGFFEAVSIKGQILITPSIYLDGGAGT